MQGMRFLILNEQGKSVNYGIITNIPAPGKFLCKFMLAPVVSRVVDVKELETYNLFDTQAEMDAFAKQLQEDQKTDGKTPPKPRDTSQPPPKPVKKKKVVKKTNGKKPK